MKASKKDREKYAVEMKKIKELNALGSMLKKDDVANAMLANAAKDSETVSQNVVDTILNDISSTRNEEKDLEIIERLTEKKGSKKVYKNKRVRLQGLGKRIKLKRKVHIVKSAKAIKRKGNR